MRLTLDTMPLTKNNRGLETVGAEEAVPFREGKLICI